MMTANFTRPSMSLSRPFPFRPMLSISGARSLLPGLGEDEIVSLIAARHLAVVFNISVGDHDRRREMRILPAAVDFYKEHGTKRLMDWDWVRITQEIMAGYRLDWITATDIRLLLNCSSEQTIRFITLGQLSLAPGSKCRRGPLGSPRVLVESLLRFLRKRRVQ